MSNVMDSLTAYLEKHVLPIANKLSTQRHLQAIRDAFISLVPVTLFGGICTILSSAPAVEPGSNFLLEAWANFAAANSTLLTWANTMTMGALSVYIALGVTYFLCKHYKIDAFIPLVLTMGGFLLICFGRWSLAGMPRRRTSSILTARACSWRSSCRFSPSRDIAPCASTMWAA